MAHYEDEREAVISNGQRAMHLQKVNIAVEVSDLAATSGAYFDAVAEVGTSTELDALVPQLHSFTHLIARLSEAPVPTRPYRTLIPAELWRRGIAGFDDVEMENLESEISDALGTVSAGNFDVNEIHALAARLRRLSSAFAELGRQEFNAVIDQPSTVA
ncbi:hypothetical protein QWI29_15125 [Mycolicibacterium neoaurum]|uniref:hypothetical protein n=1 Tax=Mycolicibacterium neoaurum TaxID=1795 RepID=UPI00267217B3|nr:hypothetical protein [Mycolicibacterium neoaurum]MDO3401369.1 hypothetical protein [Mycolicibacterium neoaurum]